MGKHNKTNSRIPLCTTGVFGCNHPRNLIQTSNIQWTNGWMMYAFACPHLYTHVEQIGIVTNQHNCI